MKKKPAQELEITINKITHQLIRLKNSVDTCDKANKAYNRLLIQRASIRKRLKNMKSKTFFSALIKKLCKKPDQKLICDYFK